MLDELSRELKEVFGRGVGSPLPDDDFDRLARRVFGHQFESNPVYRRFCAGRRVEPGTLESWTDIPAVPTRAFKRLRLFSAPGGREAEAVFRTSGTTEGRERRGEHHVPDLSLYHASLLPNFRAHLLPDGARLPLVSLVPRPEGQPDSSLSHMVGVVERELCAEGGGWFVDPETGIREEALRNALARLEDEGRPILVVGTAFAFVHWMDAMDREGWRFSLPGGSRLMETGGFKGRSRTLTREELYRGLDERLGVPPDLVVNEYGMTELLSQFYEGHLRQGHEDRPGRASGDGSRGPSGGRSRSEVPHRPPPWVRTRILDPGTLEPLPPGEEGLLCHYDLANAGSVFAVLTEDLGVADGEGFHVLGRASDAEPRGCSLAMDELLSGAGGGG